MNLKTSQENVIYIDYKWNSQNNTIEFLKSEEKEPVFFILENENSMVEDDYEVSCNLPGEDGDWTKGCNGKWSCGTLIQDCLEDGGCATNCQNRMIYIPQTKTFYLGIDM